MPKFIAGVMAEAAARSTGMGWRPGMAKVPA